MLDRGQRALWRDPPQSAVDALAPELDRPATRRGSGGPGLLDWAVDGLRRAFRQPRLAVALVLIVCGVVWALARGLQFYGLTPASIVYNLDQPPLLLVLVGTWLLYRRRMR
jgi:hypothetical protein